MTGASWDSTLYAEVVESFRRLPPPDPPTLLEITGYADRENLASNILAFFLDSSRQHGLDSLVLDALLEAAGRDTVGSSLPALSVCREVSTNNRNRIDIVVETDEVVVGIENKLRAPVSNDLGDYYAYLKNQAKGRDVAAVLLSLWPTVPDSSGFVNVLFRDFAKSLKTRLKDPGVASNCYTEFLLDFVKSMLNLSEDRQMTETRREFFGQYEDDVLGLVREIRQFQDHLRKRVVELLELVEPPEEAELKGARKFLWRDTASQFLDEVVVELPGEDGSLAVVDIYLDPDGWGISPWMRVGNRTQLSKLCAEGINLTSHPRHPDRFLWPDGARPFEVPANEVAVVANEFMRTVWRSVGAGAG